MQEPLTIAASAGIAVLVLDRAITLVRVAKNGKNGIPFSRLAHEMLIKQERTNTLLEEVVERLR